MDISITKRLIKNTIKTELRIIKSISSNFVNEITLIGNKFKGAGCTMCFIKSTIGNFTAGKENQGNELTYHFNHTIFLIIRFVD